MILRFKVITPLWTGDIDRISEMLQSTGIIGALRWWAEAILRSIGKLACDPTTDEKCPKEDKNSGKKYYCPACLIFGATGMRRAFRLTVSGGENVFSGGVLNIKPSGRNRGWYLGGGIVGEIEMKIIPLDKDFDESLVLLPFIIASEWGGIGAKNQHGYGVVEIDSCPEIDFDRFREAIEKITDRERLFKLGIELRHGNNNDLPDLREMFFAKVRFETKDSWWKKVDGIAPRLRDNYHGCINDMRIKKWVNSDSVPITPALKNWLGYGNGAGLWKTTNQNQSREIENRLFGTTKTERKASKINISCAYPVNRNLWEFRIWGWIPHNAFPAGFNRDSFLNNLKRALSGNGFITVPWNRLLGSQTRNHKLKVWREFNSSRDTVRSNESDIGNYIQSLLGGV
ncbi:MAG: type III-B CRISPR module RAMP protein Cmr1 [Synergistetes bacterium]|nr:type III-B CRISPR module RAMP protein Cmr1 [Synergistota bacterium]